LEQYERRRELERHLVEHRLQQLPGARQLGEALGPRCALLIALFDLCIDEHGTAPQAAPPRRGYFERRPEQERPLTARGNRIELATGDQEDFLRRIVGVSWTQA